MDKSVFEKPYVIIASTGRTGTQFLGAKISQMIESCTSLHEPDSLWLSRPHMWPRKIIRFGLFKATIGRFLPRYALLNLGIARLTGRLKDPEIIECMRMLRSELLSNEETSVLVEANANFAGLLDLLPEAFPNARVVYIIRDPRSWVTSWMNRSISQYSTFDVRSWFKHTRLTPFHFDGDPYQKTWKAMTVFEKLCWWWATANALSLKLAQKIDTMIFRFEDLFTKVSRDESFPRLLQYVTSFPDGFSAHWEYKPELLSKKVHSTGEGKFPKWNEWNSEQAKKLHIHCKELMERFGYGTEPEWKKKVSSP